MRESQINDYNNLIKYVGEKCKYTDSVTFEETNFKKLNYKGYLGLAKNPYKKNLFDRKLSELFEKDTSFRIKINKFNSKYEKSGLKIKNSDDFFLVGERLMKGNSKTNTSETKVDTENNEKVKKASEVKKQIPFTKKVRNFFKKMPRGLRNANAISLALLGLLISIGGAPSLITIAAVLPVGTSLFYAGRAIIKSYKSGKIRNWLNKRHNNEPVSNWEPLPSDMTDAKKENMVPVFPKAMPKVAKFSEPKKYRLKTDTNGYNPETDVPEFKNPRAEENREPLALTSGEGIDYSQYKTPRESRIEKLNERIANDNNSNTGTIDLPSNLPEAKANDANKESQSNESTKKVSKHSIEYQKEQLRSDIKKYQNGYGYRMEEFANKYLKLVDNVTDINEFNKLRENYNRDLKEMLDYEVQLENWKRDTLGNSKNKYAKEMREESKEKSKLVEVARQELEKDKLQIQKERIMSIMAENKDNNYIKSLCEVTINQINNYENKKKEFSSMSSFDRDYETKKAELDKLYNDAEFYAFSVEDVINNETSKRSRGK